MGFTLGPYGKCIFQSLHYDLLYSSIYLHVGRSSNRKLKRTLLDVTSNLPQVIADRHPCRNVTNVITGARWRRQLFFHITGSFHIDNLKICGFYHITYIPGSEREMPNPHSDYRSAAQPLILRWGLSAPPLFLINITLEVTAPNSYGCGDARLWLLSPDEKIILCPNSGSLSIIDTHCTVGLWLNYRREKAARHSRNVRYFTIISIHHQILDGEGKLSRNDFPLKAQQTSLQQ